jgi:hypothetical protein
MSDARELKERRPEAGEGSMRDAREAEGRRPEKARRQL